MTGCDEAEGARLAALRRELAAAEAANLALQAEIRRLARALAAQEAQAQAWAVRALELGRRSLADVGPEIGRH